MKSSPLIKYLKNHKIYIISPHPDDAILSVGMLLFHLKKYRKGIIVNVFTKAHKGPYTLSAKNFLKTAKYTDATKLFDDRAIEDKKAASYVNAKIINLGMTDSLFRRKPKQTLIGKYIPEFDHIYPTYRLHILKKIQQNDTAFKELKTKLKEIIPPNAIVFAPFGIGNHADHIITRQVCTRLFKNVFFYIDFPYNLRLKQSGIPPQGYEEFELDIDLSIKSKLIKYYLSQIYGLFPDAIVPPHKEKFFLLKKYVLKKL